jgi:hypothetical protein
MPLSSREHEKLVALVEKEAGATQSSLGSQWPAPIADAALIGPTGDFVRIVEPHTESDPAGLLLQFLVGMGCMMGRTAYFPVEADRHYSNLFITLVGNTSHGRKGTSWGHVRAGMKAVDERFTQYNIKGGVSSGEGIVWHLRDATDDDPGVPDKRLLVHEPEFSLPLRVMTREGNTLSAQLRQAWDSGALSLLTKNEPVRATDTHLSLVSHVTKRELLRYLNSTECANGFGNRILWGCVKRSQLLPEGGNLAPDTLQGVVKQVQNAIEFAGTIQEIKRDPEAGEMWRSVYPALTADRPGLLGSILARSEAQTMRLALVYALLDCRPTIQRRHLEAALAIMDYVTASAEWIFGELYGEPDADKILAALRESPDGLTRTEISGLFARHKLQPQIESALLVLESEELAHRQVEATDGRSAERWFIGAKQAKKAN